MRHSPMVLAAPRPRDWAPVMTPQSTTGSRPRARQLYLLDDTSGRLQFVRCKAVYQDQSLSLGVCMNTIVELSPSGASSARQVIASPSTGIVLRPLLKDSSVHGHQERGVAMLVLV